MKQRKAARGNNDVVREIAAPNDPNLPQLREEFDYTLNMRDSSVFTRARMNHETRNCVWAGQSEDGRKWTARAGEAEVFPWPGASDARVNLVDLYVRKHKAFLMTLWNKMRTTVYGTEVNDMAWANRMTSFLRWMKYTQMKCRGEHELLADYLLGRGSAVMGTFWCKQRQLGYEELDREGLVTLALQKATGPEADPRYMDLPNLVLDPSKEADAAALLAPIFEDVPSKRLEQVVADIRRDGFARFPRPVVVKNRPYVLAYSPNDDIFVSPDAHTLDDANVFAIEVMREAKFRAYAQQYDWDKEWTQDVIEHQRGMLEFGGMLFQQRLTRYASYLLPSRGQTDTRKLYLIVHAYRRLADAEGVPAIYYTVFHPHLTERCGRHEILNYDHGKMPFTMVLQERRSRRPDDSRGYGEIANTWQAQIKAEWDNRVDRASISTLPPSHYPPGQQPDKWGPGVQVPTNNPDAYGFFEPTGDPAGSKEVEDSVRRFADEYFGFAVDPENVTDSQAMRQKLGDDWMEAQMEIDTQTLQLCQQFMPDEFYFRIVGSSKGKALHATRDEIQGQFDLSIGYDVNDLDPGQKKEKMGLIELALNMDQNGIVDRTEALTVAFEMIDPNLGERLLKPAENASMSEAEDELNTAVKLLVGMKVPVKPGQAYQYRLQVLQTFLNSNQTAQQLVRSNPQVLDAVKQRLKDLNFQVQQQQNAVIGRGGPNFAGKAAAAK